MHSYHLHKKVRFICCSPWEIEKNLFLDVIPKFYSCVRVWFEDFLLNGSPEIKVTQIKVEVACWPQTTLGFMQK
jgi:hypothetical protein